MRELLQPVLLTERLESGSPVIRAPGEAYVGDNEHRNGCEREQGSDGNKPEDGGHHADERRTPEIAQDDRSRCVQLRHR